MMKKQVELWKVVVLMGLVLTAYLAGFTAAGSRGGDQAVASPAMGFPDTGAQLNQVIRSLGEVQATAKQAGDQVREINELLKSGNLQVVVKDERSPAKDEARPVERSVSGAAAGSQGRPPAPSLSRLIEH